MKNRYEDRADAGRTLAAVLEKKRDLADALVLALPRGGVPVAFEIARALGIPLDVVVVRKLGVPVQPELAMGAIATGGVRFLNDQVIGMARIGDDVIEDVTRRELAELERRERTYRGDAPALEVRGRTVIVVDDGVATGSTFRAALRAVRQMGAKRMIVACPVASPDVLARLGEEADEVVCPLTPEDLWAIGYWYDRFEQLTDAEVRSYLERARELHPGRRETPPDASTSGPSRAAPPDRGISGGAAFMAGELQVRQLDDYRWLIPAQGCMRVPGLVFADRQLMDDIFSDAEGGHAALRQVANVACLPGIVGHSIGMPDVHWGYGFAIGGVAAFDPEDGGVVSPGGVGYDINCGVRLLCSEILADDLSPEMVGLMNQIMRDVPAGIGSHHKRGKLSEEDVRGVLLEGSRWAVERGFGVQRDLDHTEAGGRLSGADPDKVSTRAIQRGRPQLGTVGSGNHFIEVGYVDDIYDSPAADQLGLAPGTVCVLIHSGSRGLGYQVCDDFLDLMLQSAARYGIDLPDRQLACAPLTSPEATRYFGAMNAAANFAFANRQMMAHEVRGAFARVLGRSWQELGLELVYDVAHNIAKWETHEVEGARRRLCVHRKGATRAFPPGHPEVPEAYRALGQPVLIPGDMGRYSYVLLGTPAAFVETFGSTCHGAGRRMSRASAKKSVAGRALKREFRERGIEVRASSYATVAEEIPEAYKDVRQVVDVVDGAGIGRKVVRLKPMGVLKG
jgi:tRNA-splicing ligase RtcB